MHPSPPSRKYPSFPGGSQHVPGCVPAGTVFLVGNKGGWGWLSGSCPLMCPLPVAPVRSGCPVSHCGAPSHPSVSCPYPRSLCPAPHISFQCPMSHLVSHPVTSCPLLAPPVPPPVPFQFLVSHPGAHIPSWFLLSHPGGSCPTLMPSCPIPAPCVLSQCHIPSRCLLSHPVSPTCAFCPISVLHVPSCHLVPHVPSQ